MTRKRFVRLLMGVFGYSRDQANDIAFTTRYGGSAYKDEFNWFYTTLEPILKGELK